jgi:tetratricopeptide (TPR) repeat protein
MKRILCLFFLLLACAAPIYSQKVVPLDARLRGGKIHFQSARYVKALEQFEAALVDFPGNPEARFWKALVLEKTGKFIESAINFDSTFISEPKWLENTQKDEMYQYSAWNAFSKAGLTLEKEANTRNAITFYNRAIQIDPTNPQGFVQLTLAYSEIDSVDGIRNMYKYDSLNPHVNEAMGRYFFKKQILDSAMFYYDKTIKIFEQEILAVQNKLSAELNLDQLKTEIITTALIKRYNTKLLEPYITDTLKIKSKFQQILKISNELYLTSLLLNNSNFFYGLSAFQTANSVSVESTQFKYLNIANLYFDRILKFDHLNYDANFNIGIIAYRLDKYIEAESVFQILANTGLVPLSSISESLSKELVGMFTTENISDGYFKITTPITNIIDKELEKRTFFSGYWYLFFTKFKDSKTLPTDAQKDSIFLSGLDLPVFEELWSYIGVVKTNLKKYDEAIKIFNNIIDLNPKNLDAYRNLAVCYREKGDSQKAYEILQQGEKMKKQQ